MKTIFRFLALGIFMTALTAVGATSAFAQDVCADVEAQQALYKVFTDNYGSKTPEGLQKAVDAGKQYVEKYGACETGKEIVDYLKTNVPKMEDRLGKMKEQNGKDARYKAFDSALKSNNAADIFTTGKSILAKEPDMLDVILVLASTGYDQAVANPPVDTYNNETINFAKSAIQKLEANAESTTKDYGVLQYSYKTKEFPDGKNNALGWMNYYIGFIDYYRLNKKQEALPYFYKATQVTSGAKNNPAVYQAIGNYYRDQVADLGKQIVGKIETVRKLEAAEPKDVDAVKAANDEAGNLIALQKGYADRAIDAYARAYKMSDPKNQTYKDGLYTTLKEIYNLRYEGKRTDVDAYVSNVSNTPLPDPTTKVTPVVEADPASSSTSAATKPSTTASPTPSTTKPVTTPAKPATPTKPVTSGDKTTTTKPMSTTTTKPTAADANKTPSKPADSAKKPTPQKKVSK